MTAPPAVTILTAFFNAEPFLDEAIGSVLRQTYEHWELLLIDDGSSDGSSAQAREYAQRYPEKIRYLEHEGHSNRGLAASRNAGLRQASGEFIAVLDADDLWEPQKLEEQVAVMQRHPDAALVFGCARYFNSTAAGAATEGFVSTPAIPLDRLYTPPCILSLIYPLTEEPAPCPSDLLFRREALQSVGGFDETFGGMLAAYEDQAVLAKIYTRYPVYASSRSWMRYRVHANSISAEVQRGGKYGQVRAFFLGWLREYLIAGMVFDSSVWKVFQRAVWREEHRQRARVARALARITKSLRLG